MCGICGYIHLDDTKRPSEAILKSMMDTLALRGPDDSGIFIKDNAALGHRRLSIIDLTTGHQPMASEDESVVIVYNGEIYNFPDIKKELANKGHRFKTHSDTEVIIHAYEEYGTGCLDLFNGMFAFAIWDARERVLFLARDRFGKKPLYYGTFDNQFIFGSELKALLKHPQVRKEIDLDALARYFAYEYVPSPLSIFKNIYKLEPASYLILKDGKADIKSYWDLKFDHSAAFNLKAAEERLITLLKESVRKRLISDVPLGVFLSGGIDSSSVVAMMAELMDPKDIKTFSIGFKEKSFDESSDARRVAEHFGTDHREEMLDPDRMLDIFPDILDLLDEPFADSSIIPTYLVSQFTRKHVKVALGGDGGDELFMGYPSFLAHRIDRRSAMIPEPLKKAFLNIASGLMPHSQKHMNLSSYIRRFAAGLDFSEDVRHQVWIGSFTPAKIKKLFLPSSDAGLSSSDIYGRTKMFFDKAGGLGCLDRASYQYIKTYMTDDILTKVDRASMANSLEVRAPFLDAEFAEFACSIPASFKLKGRTQKWILKDAMKNKLPAKTLQKSKRGFAVPVARWLKDELKPMLSEAFDKKKIEREGIFEYSYIKNIMDEFMSGKNDTRKEIWSLFMFEMWYNKWK